MVVRAHDKKNKDYLSLYECWTFSRPWAEPGNMVTNERSKTSRLERKTKWCNRFIAKGAVALPHIKKHCATFHFKTHCIFGLLVRKSTRDIIVFHQSWLLVRIQTDLLRAAATVAERNAAAFLLFSLYYPSLVASQTPVGFFCDFRWFARNSLYGF